MSMVAESPNILPAIQAVTDYAERDQENLTPEHAQILLEIRRRLERLQAQAAELQDCQTSCERSYSAPTVGRTAVFVALRQLVRT